MPSKKLSADVPIIDIRRTELDDDLRNDILEGLGQEPKSLPTLLLYDEKGLNLFEDITYLEEYYLTNAEIEVLKHDATKIAAKLPAESRLLELGSGNLRKIDILLAEFEKAQKAVEYYALDLSLDELERTFHQSSSGDYTYVKCFGLHGTYDDALYWLQRPENHEKPTCILTLGSSVGNFTRDGAADFLRSFAKVMTDKDNLVVGVDGCQDHDKVYQAYNDSKGVTHDFYRNGLKHANQCLGSTIFTKENMAIRGKYDTYLDGHVAFYEVQRDFEVEGIHLKKGDNINLERAVKYSQPQIEALWQEAGLQEVDVFSGASRTHRIHLLSAKPVSYPSRPEVYARDAVPSLSDWQDLWKAWDTVTLGMVPQEELLSKPIKLRNALVFYLGHIPTFLDIHLTRATKSDLTEPKSYPQIFERGIDPDVENPELCHAHSAIPDEYPPMSEILEYQQKVRDRVRKLLGSGKADFDRVVGRALWIGFEHEVMHLETFLYMLLQSDKALPPPHEIVPDFAAMAKKAADAAVPNKWFTIPQHTLTLGMQDNSKKDNGHFGWDNEIPHRRVTVPSFEAQGRPISNGEYAKYLEAMGDSKLPASWISVHSGKSISSPDHCLDKCVKTVFGPIPLVYALEWPVFASYDELSGYASWAGGRIPTYEESRSLAYYAEWIKKDQACKSLAQNIPAVNGHLSNNGVEITPPSTPSRDLDSATGESNLYIDLQGCNVGFKHWHPTPITQNGDRLCGQSDSGGVWEWTSSPLKSHEGFEAMDLYPGYTADFFDDKHNIVVGGSWATHPRIAGRTTFVNWYQRNYPFAWAGARLVRDI